MRDWLLPPKRREIRRDLRKYAGDAMTGKRDLLAATPALNSFERPVLGAWTSRLVDIADCYTLIPEDQPAELAREIRQFASARSAGCSD
jgi:hypothetical protein